MAVWYDRVTGELIKQLPDTVISGRYIVDDTCSFNGHKTIEKGDFLVNDGTDNFNVDNQQGFFTKSVKTEQDTTEFGIIESAILAYQEAIDSGKKSSFLIPDQLLARFELSKFEELIFNVLKKGHLEEIARDPRKELIYQEHLVPVSRAKKIAASANIHLASHSECWQTRTLTGVVPKQVLALESEEQLNIYENRVYVKLLSFTESYLLKRVLEVKRLEELFKEAMDFQDAEDIYFELRESIFKLWGEGFSNNTQADNAAANGVTTLKVLTLMLKKVRTLQHSKLYRLLSQNLHVPLKLNMTNVLSHDQHYLHVARLWNSWLETQQVKKVDPEFIFMRNQKVTTSYINYCADLIKRTLNELGFIEKDDNLFERNGINTISFSLTERSEIILSVGNQFICFVPCFTENIMDEKVAKGGQTQRVFLTLNSASDVSDNVICSSPTNFYSLELLAVFISKWLAKETYQSLGLSVSKVPVLLIDELKGMNDNYWEVEKNSIVASKPFSSIIPKISDILQKYNRDITIKNSVDKIIKMAESYDRLLNCPCCGSQVNENQWVSRDDSCFSIRHSNCKHSWEVNRQADGSKVLVISPAKLPESNRIYGFEQFGRYRMTINI
jgi:hypothetical protein